MFTIVKVMDSWGCRSLLVVRDIPRETCPPVIVLVSVGFGYAAARTFTVLEAKPVSALAHRIAWKESFLSAIMFQHVVKDVTTCVHRKFRISSGALTLAGAARAVLQYSSLPIISLWKFTPC